MAGNVRPLEELIVDQVEYLASLKGNLTAEDQAKLAEIKKNPFAGMNLPTPYLADLKGYRPDVEAKSLNTPMLILQGERDYQVTMKDFILWKSALGGQSNVTFHTYPKLNHLFIAGEGKSQPEEYQEPGHVDEQVISDIANWILQNRFSSIVLLTQPTRRFSMPFSFRLSAVASCPEVRWKAGQLRSHVWRASLTRCSVAGIRFTTCHAPREKGARIWRVSICLSNSGCSSHSALRPA